MTKEELMARAFDCSLRDDEIRAMRDRVFGRPSSDGNWDGCWDHWKEVGSVKWLKEQCEMMDAKGRV